ncbi:MAG: putative metalloprotease CJM1_0395 family protein [Desulfobacteraceae bacterium]
MKLHIWPPGVGSPDATIRKMQQIRRAALAPAQPSGTDRAVAAQAAQIEAQARMEKLQEVKEYADAATPDAAQPRPTGQQKDRSAAKSIGSQINQLA